MTEQHNSPPYSEEQTTAWLAWLAYHMQRHDQSVFHIEDLQPTWLVSWRETKSFLLGTRMLLGLFPGLILGLILALDSRSIGDLLFGVIEGLSYGLIFGLGVGLSEMAIPIYMLDNWLRARVNPQDILSTGIFVFGLTSGLIGGLWGLFVGLTYGAVGDELTNGLISGVLYGSIGGLVVAVPRVSRITMRTPGMRIQTVESIEWSWSNARQNARKGWRFGERAHLAINLFFSVICGLVFSAYGVNLLNMFHTVIAWIVALIFGLFFGAIVSAFIHFFLRVPLGFGGGLIGWLIGGFQSGLPEMKIRPNQGIFMTIRSALKIGIGAGSVVSVIIFGGVFLLENNIEMSIISALAAGGLVTLIASLWYGGLDVLEHGLLRFIIAWQGRAPFNYARFLDYAVDELNFLQKVGGGYTFIHRYLLEHFATISVDRGIVSPAEEAKPKRSL